MQKRVEGVEEHPEGEGESGETAGPAQVASPPVCRHCCCCLCVCVPTQTDSKFEIFIVKMQAQQNFEESFRFHMGFTQKSTKNRK